MIRLDTARAHCIATVTGVDLHASDRAVDLLLALRLHAYSAAEGHDARLSCRKPSPLFDVLVSSTSNGEDPAMRTINLGTADDLPEVDWHEIETTIGDGTPPAQDGVNTRTTWLTTLNADGSAHTVPVGAIWIDGTFWFQTGPSTLKARNVARDPRCTLAVSVRDADVVIEGVATRVTDAEHLARAARGWADQGWPAEVDPSGTGITAPFNAPTQGPAPWNVYRIDPVSAVVCRCVEPGGLTRFVF